MCVRMQAFISFQQKINKSSYLAIIQPCNKTNNQSMYILGEVMTIVVFTKKYKCAKYRRVCYVYLYCAPTHYIYSGKTLEKLSTIQDIYTEIDK